MAESTSTVYVRPPVHMLIIAVAVGGAFYLAGKHIEVRGPTTNPATISVSADAKVSTPPDIAMLSFGVTTGRQSTAKDATTNIAKNMTAVIAAVKALGIEEKDITTQSFSLNPVYDYTTNGQIPRGFEATQMLSVKVRDLDKVGDVLTAATNAGANQANGISFSVDQPDEMKAKAREMAIEKAKAKAQVLAHDLGMSLGRITGFTEDGNYYSPPTPMMMRSDMAGATKEMANIQIPTGEQDITSNVTITYELR